MRALFATSFTALLVLGAGLLFYDTGGDQQPLDWRGGSFEGPTGREAFKARIGNDWFVVADGKRGERFDEIKTVLYELDDALVDFRVLTESGALVYAGRRDNDWFVVKEEQLFGPYSDVRFYTESGGTGAFKARHDATWFIVSDEKEGPRYDWVGIPRISPTGSVAYAARDGEAWYLVHNGKRALGPFDWVGLPAFDTDGAAVVAVRGRGREMIVSSNNQAPSFTITDTEPAARLLLPTRDTAAPVANTHTELSQMNDRELDAFLRVLAARLESRLDWFDEEEGREHLTLRNALANARQALYAFESDERGRDALSAALEHLENAADSLVTAGAFIASPCPRGGAYDTLCSIQADLAELRHQVE